MLKVSAATVTQPASHITYATTWLVSSSISSFPLCLAVSLSLSLSYTSQVCGKALEPDEEEQEQQRQHFTGGTEAGRTPISGPAGGQPQETQQPQQGQAQPAAEGKQAELSGGEKVVERREGGLQAQGGQKEPQKQRRYLIHEFPGQCCQHTHSHSAQPGCVDAALTHNQSALICCSFVFASRPY